MTANFAAHVLDAEASLHALLLGGPSPATSHASTLHFLEPPFSNRGPAAMAVLARDCPSIAPVF